ncbi:hypothetical protein Bca101_076786 [Brassica carinata]
MPTRKHGRPPKPKGIRTTVRASPKTYSGMGSKKRNIVRLQASPGTSSRAGTRQTTQQAASSASATTPPIIWSSSFSPADCASFSEAFPGSSLLTLLPPWGLTGNIFPWVVWRIWTAKNYLIFENRAWTPLEILTKAVSNAKEWHLAQISTTQPRSSMSLSSNPPLQTTSLLCFTDAAWHATSSRAGCGWIFITEQDEQFHQGTATFDNTPSALVAEALAIRSALLNALEAGFTRICIKSDCQALVAVINSKNHPKDLHGTSSIYPCPLIVLFFLMFPETCTLWLIHLLNQLCTGLPPTILSWAVDL